MRTLLALSALVLGLVGANAVPAQASHGSTTSPSDSPRGVATAGFTRNLLGYSQFRQSGATVTVRGQYLRLTPGMSYHTVIYTNGNCDPAGAFPVGYFTADSRGNASFAKTVQNPTFPVSATMSMSVRMADTNADLDGDGKTGPSDVVAVPGQPSIGLIECNPMPYVVGS